MKKILFICHGNICRSPMAEFVMKDLVEKANLTDDFFINSKATSTEEIGNGVHYGTINELKKHGIKFIHILRHKLQKMIIKILIF